ncbi:2Fe-2S iron-sulfur cluster-binding protein [Bradyrhizobium sp. USDA 10063]
MSIITVLPSGKMIGVTERTSLLAALRGAKIVIPHKCEGQAKCGSCHILVQRGHTGLSEVTRKEIDTLNTIVGVGSKSRLACQAKVLGTRNMIIELLGFDAGL